MKRGVTPRTGAIVDAQGLVGLEATINQLGRAQLDFSKRNSNLGVQIARELDFLRLWQRFAAWRFERGSVRDHSFRSGERIPGRAAKKPNPFASITWIRFNGSAPNPFGTLSAFSPELVRRSVGSPVSLER